MAKCTTCPAPQQRFYQFIVETANSEAYQDQATRLMSEVGPMKWWGLWGKRKVNEQSEWAVLHSLR